MKVSKQKARKQESNEMEAQSQYVPILQEGKAKIKLSFHSLLSVLGLHEAGSVLLIKY